MLRYDTPEVMGLDEAHIDDKFRLVVTDNKNKILLDMLPNNKPATVLKFLRNLPDKGNVKAVIGSQMPLRRVPTTSSRESKSKAKDTTLRRSERLHFSAAGWKNLRNSIAKMQNS